MSKKKIVLLTVSGLIVLPIVLLLVAWWLTQVIPPWYDPPKPSEKELLAIEAERLRITADFGTHAKKAEPFFLELSGRQIREMFAAYVIRNRLLPDDIADPDIALRDGAFWLAARITWNQQQSIASIRLRPFVDSAGLLHIQMDSLKAGALGLPDNWLADTLAKLEKSLKARLAASKSNSDTARTARKNQDLIGRISAALDGLPVPTTFRTREDLQMTVEHIRITPDHVEIKFRPLPND